MQHIHTRDLEEAVHLVQQIYCPHEMKLQQRAISIDTNLAISGPDDWPVVRLSHGAAVAVDAGDFKDLFLIMQCASGAGSVRQGSHSQDWRPGSIVPISANQGTSFKFNAEFSQITFRPDKARLELLCSRWLGHPLDDDLRFELRPFPPALETAWAPILAIIESNSGRLPRAAEAALEEFVLTFLLTSHEHNFTAALTRSQPAVSSRLVRRAENYIAEHADSALSVADIAGALGVSMRALQAGFKEWRQITPAAYLRDVRLSRAREDLLNAAPGATVMDAALAHGFVHLGRFAERYKARYGESPLATLTRRRARSIKQTEILPGEGNPRSKTSHIG